MYASRDALGPHQTVGKPLPVPQQKRPHPLVAQKRTPLIVVYQGLGKPPHLGLEKDLGLRPRPKGQLRRRRWP